MNPGQRCNPPPTGDPPAACCHQRKWWWITGGIAAAGAVALVAWRGEPPPPAAKPQPQIVLHSDLKTGGKLTTISYQEAIRSCMGNVEACPTGDQRMIRPYFHSFLQMLHIGFVSHRPVSISPDAVWLMICNGFAVHAEVGGKDLQRKLFPGSGGEKVLLTVRRDDFRKGANNDWESVFAEFAKQMDGHLGNDLKATLTDTFSTTGPKERAAFEITFMKAMEQSFG